MTDNNDEEPLDPFDTTLQSTGTPTLSRLASGVMIDGR